MKENKLSLVSMLLGENFDAEAQTPASGEFPPGTPEGAAELNDYFRSNGAPIGGTEIPAVVVCTNVDMGELDGELYSYKGGTYTAWSNEHFHSGFIPVTGAESRQILQVLVRVDKSAVKF